jgi:hypothetical protein
MDKDMWMNTHDGGKGDQQRPLTIPKEQFEANWDAIFKPNPLADKIVKQVEEALKNERK